MSSWTQADANGFNRHGYLADRSDNLVALLVAYLAGAPNGWADDPDGPQLQLVLRTPAGEELGTAGLEARHLRELSFDLRAGIERQRQGDAREERCQEMTSLIVQARLAGEDVGNVLAYCLHAAADRLYLGAARLVHGRPGSWEAATVIRWAQFGGTEPRWPGRDRLIELFRAMGDAKDDGGQVVSDALGYAAWELAAHEPKADPPLGPLRALCDGSGWAGDLWAMARPLNLEDEWEPDR